VQEKISEYPFLDDPAGQVAGAGTELPTRNLQISLENCRTGFEHSAASYVGLQQERDILMAPV